MIGFKTEARTQVVDVVLALEVREGLLVPGLG